MTDERLAEIKDWIDGPLWRALSRDAARELIAEIDRLRERIEQLEYMEARSAAEAKAERDRAEFWKAETGKRVALLAALEWAGSDFDRTCPYCGSTDNKMNPGKHKMACALARLMTMPEEPKP